ncbi:MAG: hypothetical protein Q8K70_09185 [Bacteroidota bacterium]|nr:hypothetical protein [Bacteroidota bacterium]
MSNSGKQIAVFIAFLGIFLGSALVMYNHYIKDKPRIKVVSPRTDVDPVLFDSLLIEKNKDKQLGK